MELASRFGEAMSRAGSRALDFALPPRCAGCRRGLPVVLALERVHATAAQHALGRSGRAENVGHAFRIRTPEAGGRIAGRWIVLVDDVTTTGATLAACGQALVEAGATAVSAVT